MFPEEFETFLLTDPRTRECFLHHHADLLDAGWWQAMQREIRSRPSSSKCCPMPTPSASAGPRPQRVALADIRADCRITGMRDRRAIAARRGTAHCRASTRPRNPDVRRHLVARCHRRRSPPAATPSKEEQEAAKNTFACQLAGERVVIRFDAGEARMLMPDGDRVALYQIAAASGVRYSNGIMELRGKGMDLHLIRNGVATTLRSASRIAVPALGR